MRPLRATCLLAVGLLAACATGPRPEALDAARLRPAVWAQPLDLPGVPNLHKVSAALYRSAQPTARGMKSLAALGVKTVVDLRFWHGDREKIGRAPLAAERIAMVPWDLDEDDAVRFLRIATDPARAPVLVHCHDGADRTGAFCALYRICVQGWTREQAIREMVDGGYGYHEIWLNVVPWLRSLDLDRVRREAGIERDTGSWVGS